MTSLFFFMIAPSDTPNETYAVEPPLHASLKCGVKRSSWHHKYNTTQINAKKNFMKIHVDALDSLS